MLKPIIPFSAFANIDLRVGKIVAIEDVPQSEKLYRLTVDFGSEIGKKIIFAGIKKWYSKQKLRNKKFIFIANLEPRSMMGEESQGMMLAIDHQDMPLLLPVNKNAIEGSPLR